MSTFTWTPDIGASMKRTPRIRSVKFGDGYEQRGPDGIHADLQSWDVTFQDRTTEEIDAIETWFADRYGVIPFPWTPPFSATARRFVCRSWSRVPHVFDCESISATFEEVADPT